MLKDTRSQTVICTGCPLFNVCPAVNCFDAEKCPLVAAVKATER